MSANPPLESRGHRRVRAIALRIAAIVVALGLWFWTQSLIGARGFPEGGLGDGLHQLTAGVHHWLQEVPARAMRSSCSAPWSSTWSGSSC